jgi:hypothetical protein
MATMLSLETQTLFAELAEVLRLRDLMRSFGALKGAFIQREVKEQIYWYFRTSEGLGQQDFYVGKAKDPVAERAIESYKVARPSEEDSEARIKRLVAMLRPGGVHVMDAPTGKVVRALAASGVFHLGGVLVGTQAYLALGNAAGVRWGSGLATQDIDVAAWTRAGDGSLEVALPKGIADIPGTLETLQMGFLPVPGLEPNTPSSSYKMRGQDLRVDILTPGRGKPVPVPRFRTAAARLPFLDYLLKDTFESPALNGGAVLVRLPSWARFAVHKLAVADQRPASEQAKAAKDRAQAVEVLTWLEEVRPGDLELALEELATKARMAWAVRIARSARLVRGLQPEIQLKFDQAEKSARG